MKGKRTVIESEVITSDEIKMILDRYRIGKKPLAKLLGWGETTIIRYMEGDIPTNEYSNKLKAILNNPEFYYELLMNKQDCLTGVAFKKSRKAVLSKIMCSRVYAVTYYLVNKSNGEICASYMQYLLYYIQAFSLAMYDREMFQEEYAINKEQIPYPKIYEAMKRCGMHTLEFEDEFLPAEEEEIVNAVYDAFGWYGPKALEALTAFEKSMFKVTRDKFNNKIASKETLKSYFKEIINQYNITGLKDISNYPNKRIQDIKEMSM